MIGKQNAHIPAAMGPPDFPSLRRLVKKSRQGTGRVGALISSARFKVTERDFTVLIVSCRKRREWRKAVEIFNSVCLCGPDLLVPNFYTYSAVISVCSKSGALATALELFSEMKSAARVDCSLAPDASIYRLLISAAKSCAEYDTALELYREAEASELELDSTAITCALCASMELGSWARALDLLDALHGVGVEGGADVRGYYIHVMSSCARMGDVGLVVEALLMMQMNGEEADEWAMGAVVEAALVARNVEVGLDALEEMLKSGMRISTGIRAGLVKMLREEGRGEQLKMVEGLFRENLKLGQTARTRSAQF